jgi:YVTN family beta-propeller protein
LLAGIVLGFTIGVFALASPALAFSRQAPPPNTILATVPVGAGQEPQGIAVDPVRHEIFEVSFEGTLSVINQRTDTVADTINLGHGYWVALALDPYTGNVYVASETYNGGGTIDIVSARTDAVTASIPTSNDPHAIAINPYDHLVYVANYCEPSCMQGSVSVMHEGTNTVTATIPVGPEPQDVVLDPHRGQGFVTNYGSEYPGGGTVTAFSTRTNAVTGTIPVGSYPWGEAVDPVTGNVYVADVFGDSVSVISERSDAVTDTIPLGTGVRPIYVAADSASGDVYVSIVGSSDLDVVHERTDAVTDTITVPSVGEATVDPLIGKVYVDSRGSSPANLANITIIQAASKWWDVR